jgi:hypothetical protein
LLFQAVLRYKSEKEDFGRRIKTHFKYKNEGAVEVVLNYIEYPYLADLKVTINGEKMALLLRLSGKGEIAILNEK